MFGEITEQLTHHNDVLGKISVKLAEMNAQLISHHNTLGEMKEHFAQQDDLLETVATEVNSISTLLEPTIPMQHAHEQRISRLERGYTRLILKS